MAITAPDAFASETGAKGTFRISRSGSTAANLTVWVAVSGTATRNDDYTISGGSPTLSGLVAVIPAGASFLDLTVHPKADTLSDGPETVVLTLAKRASYNLAARTSATVTIAEAPTLNKPNVVVIMTDDMTAADIQVMPETLRLLGERGVTFTNSFTDFSLCCTSRATFLTGQAAHNHGILGNHPSAGGGYELFKPTENNTLPVWLRNGGYRTFAYTKYMNGYGGWTQSAPLADRQHVPPGWDVWFGRVDYHAYRFYDYDLNQNGALVHRGCNTIDYDTDLAATKAVGFIANNQTVPKPLFMWIAPLAPHNTFSGRCDREVFRGPMPADRHLHKLDSHVVQQAPSTNEFDVSDKPSFIAALPLLTFKQRTELVQQIRRRRESLLAVDELVKKVVMTLQSTGRLQNTLIIFTSDNGYLMGEHRIENQKVYPYEESIRVPLVISGPGIPWGEARSQLVSNIDLAATILDFAGFPVTIPNVPPTTPGRVQDGRSLKPLMENAGTPWRTALLIQGSVYATNPFIRFQGVRTESAKYIEYNNTIGESELYDLTTDPRELENKAAMPGSPPALKSELELVLENMLSTLRTCAGSTCWVD
ncbi:MAG TPA: sulfatase [Xanthobacteraceae bacterium]|nr:sulfatase [Xanthobacteraceae bacterium]